MAKITLKYEAGRKSPFQVLWREHGKRYSRFFETEIARERFIEANSFLEREKFGAFF